MWGLIGGNPDGDAYNRRNQQPPLKPQGGGRHEDDMVSNIPQLPLLVTQRDDTPTTHHHDEIDPSIQRVSPLSRYRNLRQENNYEDQYQNPHHPPINQQQPFYPPNNNSSPEVVVLNQPESMNKKQLPGAYHRPYHKYPSPSQEQVNYRDNEGVVPPLEPPVSSIDPIHQGNDQQMINSLEKQAVTTFVKEVLSPFIDNII